MDIRRIISYEFKKFDNAALNLILEDNLKQGLHTIRFTVGLSQDLRDYLAGEIDPVTERELILNGYVGSVADGRVILVTNGVFQSQEKPRTAEGYSYTLGLLFTATFKKKYYLENL